MTINAANWVGGATAEHAVGRDNRADEKHADEFAGLLAGAVKETVPKPEPRKLKEGTSELDRPDEKKPEKEDDDDSRKVKRSRVRARPVTNPSATNEVVQTTAALDPELQAKLARVIARMRDEAGQNVTIAETYRSQERQNTLYAQGRETTGDVVTWTLNSKHTQGRAVDVMLDGSAAANGFDAYDALQRIAKEEGLRTLGARDPGHLELPGSGQPLHATGAANDVTSLIPAEPADATGPGQVSIASVAQVAQLAEVVVAKPAEVARVAQVARPAAASAPSRTNAIPATSGSHNAHAAEGAYAGSSERASAESNDQGSGSSGGNSKGEQRGGLSALAAAVALRDAAPTHVGSSPVHGAAASTAMSSAERAAQIIAAYQDAPARPLSQITMNVDAGNGVTDKVQIAMRGTSLNAAIDTGDARGAQVMTQRADELVKALSRDGIEVDTLRVRAAVSTIAATAAPSGQSTTDTSTHSRFERQQAWQQQDRQRSQDDRRQQQRNPRGGQER